MSHVRLGLSIRTFEAVGVDDLHLSPQQSGRRMTFSDCGCLGYGTTV